MKLYCVKVKYKKGGIEIYHMLGNSNKDILKRMDKALEESQNHLDNPFIDYNFFEINQVDGFDIREMLKYYKIKIK